LRSAEVTGERIRDKIAASKKKGIWVGGIIPFGYRLENRKLVIEESEPGSSGSSSSAISRSPLSEPSNGSSIQPGF
jgi:DNA invertase Pin-like site-specific DNA recombinase